MPPRPDPLVDATAALVTSQAAARDRIAANVLAQVSRLWTRSADPTDPARVDQFIGRVLELVQAGQQQTADVTASYLRMLLEQTPDADAPMTAVSLPPTLRRVNDPAAPYRRPLVQWSTDTSRGVENTVAKERGYRRLMVMVDSDLTAAMREASRQTVTDNPSVIGMRRIVRPELSRGGTCGLCVAAADRLYSPQLLMPIHARCNCENAPVTRAHDPGHKLNQQDFQALYVDGASAQALKRVRIAVSEHGEQGPTLRRASDQFRGPNADAVKPDRAPRDMTVIELDREMQAALEAEDFDRFERLAAETDRREAKRDRDRARRGEQRQARDEARAAELEALLDKGHSDEEAFERVYGVSVEQQRRTAAIAMLRAEGYRGKGFNELSRDSWKDRVWATYDDAERATNGYMVNADGVRKGVTEAELFTADEAFVRRYASRELQEWFDQGNRVTLAEHRAELLGDNQAAYRERMAQGYVYQ